MTWLVVVVCKGLLNSTGSQIRPVASLYRNLSQVVDI